jgi:hypothetical protein
MSSIIVKGMRIPENCIKCPLQFGGWCYVSPPEIDERVAPTVDEAVEQGKPEWCPLVDLGKHGDLIDRQKLIEDNKHLEYPTDGKYRRDRAWAVGFNAGAKHCNEHAVYAKAVIEAEDGT